MTLTQTAVNCVIVVFPVIFYTTVLKETGIEHYDDMLDSKNLCSNYLHIILFVSFFVNGLEKEMKVN